MSHTLGNLRMWVLGDQDIPVHGVLAVDNYNTYVLGKQPPGAPPVDI